jgi:predicted RNA binding protein YcfA (HicA-like mRNA interferase family)
MKPQEVLRVLLRNGFVERKSKSSHRQLVRKAPPPARLVTVPFHSGDVPKRTLKSIATQAGKSIDEFQ